MVNKHNFFIYTEYEVEQIKSQLTIGSDFQKASKLDDDKILLMKGIFNDWVHLKFKNISSFEKQFYQTQYELSKNTISDQSPPNLKSLVHIK